MTGATLGLPLLAGSGGALIACETHTRPSGFLSANLRSTSHAVKVGAAPRRGGGRVIVARAELRVRPRDRCLACMLSSGDRVRLLALPAPSRRGLHHPRRPARRLLPRRPRERIEVVHDARSSSLMARVAFGMRVRVEVCSCRPPSAKGRREPSQRLAHVDSDSPAWSSRMESAMNCTVHQILKS